MALIISIAMMVAASMLIGLLPPHASVGQQGAADPTFRDESTESSPFAPQRTRRPQRHYTKIRFGNISAAQRMAIKFVVKTCAS